MATRNAVLSVEVLVDSAKAATGLDNASSKVDRFRSSVDKMVAPSAAVLAGIGLVGKQAVDSASRAEQAFGALDSVFGKNADVVKAWANDAATSVGLSKSEYAEFASVIGAQLGNLGVPMDKVAGNTNDLITLGADLAATFGGSTADAVDALSAALRGESDPAERLGLNLSQTAVNARLAEKGMDKLTGSALTSAKAQTVMELATEQAGGAVGQFGRESDTVAGQTQIAAARFEDMKAALGEALLPAVTMVASALGDLAGWVQQNSTLVLVLTGIVGGLAAGVIALSAALRIWAALQAAWTAATKIATGVQVAFNAVMRANPIGLVITAVTLLVAGIVLLWQKNEGFRNFVTAAWKAIQQAALVAWNAIKSAVSAVLSWVTQRVNTVKAFVSAAWAAIKLAATNAWNAIKSVVLTVAQWITTRINILKSAVSIVWTSIKNAASTAWNGVKNIVTTVTNSIKSIVNGIKSAVNNVWTGIKNAATTAFNAILAPVRAVQNAFNAVVGAVQSLIGWIGRIKFPEPPSWLKSAGSAIGGIFSRSSPAAFAPSPFGVAVAGGSSPTLRAATGRGASPLFGSAGGVTINVNGGLDSADAIARRVRDVLAGRDRRAGSVRIGRVVPT